MRGGATESSFAREQPILGAPGGLREAVNISGGVGYPSATDGGNPQPFSTGSYAAAGGRRRKTKKSVKAIKRLLKARGLKVSGSRRAVTARARKARIPLKGGGPITGSAYRSYMGGEGNMDGGLASEYNKAHPVDNNVQTLPGYGGDSSAFRSSASGGLVPA